MKLYPKVRELVRMILFRLIHMIWKPSKHGKELCFWNKQFKKDHLKNAHYKKIMLAMAEEKDDQFLKGKVVADFGCGPRGSLTWIDSPLIRIGIDVLADVYAEAFRESIISHGMVYVKSTEKVIPLPSDFVDVLFTMNALDHTDDLDAMCKEMLRIMKPGGEFLGSFNLDEPPTICEPQTLTETVIHKSLLNHLEIKSYRLNAQGPEGKRYAYFFQEKSCYEKGQRGVLWVRAAKPGHIQVSTPPIAA